VTGLVTGHVLLLPLIGIIFVVETGSVILQVASVKLTGKRIFLFTPIHHHFERLGWAETQITFRFWIYRCDRRRSRHRYLPRHTSPRMSSNGLTLEDLEASAIAAGSLRGRNVVILGGGRTGQATAAFAAGAGANVTVHDTDAI